MARAGQAVLKLLALTVAVLFALGVVLAVGEIFFFGSSKVRPLFGMSADALAGDRDAGPDPSEPRPLDRATRDGGSPAP